MNAPHSGTESLRRPQRKISGPAEGPAGRAMMRRIWETHPAQGTGAVLAAFADAAASGQVDWRRPGHARDPMAHAQNVYASACREGWLRAS